jgi:hypothetical protein
MNNSNKIWVTLCHFPVNSISLFPASEEVLGRLVSALVIEVSVLRSGLSSDKTDLRRQFAHIPLQAKAVF